MRATRILLFSGLLLFSGCTSMMPNWLRYMFRGTPAERVAKNEKKVEVSLGAVAAGIRDNIHMASTAMDTPPTPRRDEVVKNILAQSETILVKRYPSTPEHDAQLFELVTRLLSDNEKIRARAESDQARLAETTAAAAEQYASDMAEKARLANLLNEQIAEGEKLAHWKRVAEWSATGVIIFFVLAQVLTLVAKANPAFAAASAVLNTVAAPAVQFAYSRAKTGLKRIGASVVQLTKELPVDEFNKVTSALRDHLDTDHKQIVNDAMAVAAAVANPVISAATPTT